MEGSLRASGSIALAGRPAGRPTTRMIDTNRPLLRECSAAACSSALLSVLALASLALLRGSPDLWRWESLAGRQFAAASSAPLAHAKPPVGQGRANGRMADSRPAERRAASGERRSQQVATSAASPSPPCGIWQRERYTHTHTAGSVCSASAGRSVEGGRRFGGQTFQVSPLVVGRDWSPVCMFAPSGCVAVVRRTAALGRQHSYSHH